MSETGIVEEWSRLLRRVAALGTVLFLCVFTGSCLAEPQLRSAAHGYLVREVTAGIQAKLGGKAGELAESASRLGRILKKEANSAPQDMEEAVGFLVSGWLSDRCNCAPSQVEMAETLATRAAIDWSKPTVERLKRRAEALKDFAQGNYKARWDALLVEVRIFSISNAALFLCCLLTIQFRPTRAGFVVWPLTLLTLTTLGAIYLWIAAQDWFWSFLTKDYLGWIYLGEVGILFLVLAHASLGRVPPD